jgi:hypothetical protein
LKVRAVQRARAVQSSRVSRVSRVTRDIRVSGVSKVSRIVLVIRWYGDVPCFSPPAVSLLSLRPIAGAREPPEGPLRRGIGVRRVLQGYYKSVRVLQECYKGLTRVLHVPC